VCTAPAWPPCPSKYTSPYPCNDPTEHNVRRLTLTAQPARRTKSGMRGAIHVFPSVEASPDPVSLTPLSESQFGSTRRTRPLAQVEFAGTSSPTHVIEVLHVPASLLGSTMMANCFRRGGTTSQWWLKSACAHGRLLLGVPALHWGIVLSSGRESTHSSKRRKRRVFRFGWYRQILPLHP
jgi:hypothetical protein